MQISENPDAESGLKRALGPFHLTTLGIGDAAGRATFRTRSTMTPTYKRKNVKRVYTDAEIKEAVEATDNLHQATKLLGINKGNYGRFRRFVPESPRSTQPF